MSKLNVTPTFAQAWREYNDQYRMANDSTYVPSGSDINKLNTVVFIMYTYPTDSKEPGLNDYTKE